jgi:protein-tyrosine phosphatase
MTAAIAVPGTSNFRDFGGGRTASGEAVVAGRLFRSAHLGGVGDEGAGRLAALGIATIIDLRGASERAAAPARFAEAHGIAVVSTPVEPAATPQIRALITGGAASAVAIRDIMIDNYRRYVAEEAASFGLALTALGEAATAPLVVHCTAGKDRTGFLVAVVQALLGIPREAIYAGYAATNQAWDRSASAAIPLIVDRDAREALLVADPDYLDAAFAEIATRHGTVADFVRAALGGEARDVHRLTRRLIEAEMLQGVAS